VCSKCSKTRALVPGLKGLQRICNECRRQDSTGSDSSHAASGAQRDGEGMHASSDKREDALSDGWSLSLVSPGVPDDGDKENALGSSNVTVARCGTSGASSLLLRNAGLFRTVFPQKVVSKHRLIAPEDPDQTTATQGQLVTLLFTAGLARVKGAQYLPWTNAFRRRPA
jgi:hypothetical protein